jgi:Outer membrane receptor proteins, mostly Fe transport
MLGKKLFLFLVFPLIGMCALAQNANFVVEGIVEDRVTKESLPGASFFVKELNTGVVADMDGKYRISLKAGTYTVQVSFVGYKTNVIRLEVSASQKMNVAMDSDTTLDEVVVTARARDENIAGLTMGVEKLSMKQIKKMPALMGEVDVIKAVQLLPGVQPTSEGGSGFSVRGGSPDQNMILLDNTLLYNASHLMGFFSVFNNDVVSDLELYKGDLPIKHGGRLASLLDIKTVDDMPEKVQGTGGIGLILSRLVLQGPVGEKTSWLVGGRRSYADILMKGSGNDDFKDLVLNFYDLNAKMTHRFSDKDVLSFNAYYGRDNFGSDLYGFSYGNLASSLTWSHSYSEKLFSKISMNLTNYDYKLSSEFEGAVMDWKSNINDIMLRADFTYLANEKIRTNFGATSTLHRFSPAIITTQDYGNYKMDNVYAIGNSIYAANEHELTDKLSVKYGIRWNIFQNVGSATVYNYGEDYARTDSSVYKSGEVYHTYNALEPRAGLVYKLTDNSSVKANYARNTQFIQLANSSSSGSPLDIWFLASPNIKPQNVDMFSAGYFHNFDDNVYETSVELYHKSMNNVIDFADHAQLIMNKFLEGDVRTGTGQAYGAEFMVRKNSGTVNGFVNYTLSRTERTIPGINDGNTYLSPFDKMHSINVVLNYELSRKITLSTAWVYATGTPTTYPSGRFGIDGEYFPIYSGRNEYRQPDYHRLDLSCTYVPNPDSKKWWKGEWNFSVYNAYGRKNPYMITFNQDEMTGIPFAESIYLFQFVPSVTYNFKF